MASPEWKWLLQQMTDRELLKMARLARVKASRLRSNRAERGPLVDRAKTIHLLLQARTLSRLRRALDQFVKADTALLSFRSLADEELHQAVSTGQPPKQIFLSLLACPDPASGGKAGRLFDWMRSTGALRGWLEEPLPAPTEQPQGRDELAELQKQQIAWNEERGQFSQRILALEAELLEAHFGNTRNQRIWEAERQSLLSRLADRETRLQLRDQQLADCLKQRNEAGSVMTGQLVQAEPLPEQGSPEHRPSVLLVCNLASAPPEAEINYQVTVVTPADIQNGQSDGVVAQADQVWLLTYAVPLPIQRRLRREAADRLRDFASYDELLTFIEEGRRT